MLQILGKDPELAYFSSLLHFSKEDWLKLIKAKKKYFSKEQLELPVNFYETCSPIAESWTNSYSAGVNIELQALKRPFLNSVHFSKIQKENRLLIKSAEPIFKTFRLAVRSIKYTLHLFDKNGVLILTDTTLTNVSPALAPASGTVWNEDIIGTNAYSLSLQIKQPVVLPGFLHYSDIFDDLICSAAPIVDDNEEIIGGVAFVQPYRGHPWNDSFQNQKEQSLGQIIRLASRIEDNLRFEQTHISMNKLSNEINTILDASGEGLITIDQAAIITNVNQVASQILKLNSSQIIGKSITNFFGKEPHITNLIDKGAKVDFEQTIGSNKQQFLINAFPLLNETTKGIDGAVLRINFTKEKNNTTKSGLTARFNFNSLIGTSKDFVKIIELSKKYALSNENILIIGESGTGKELFAQAIHNLHSPNGPFVAVNCAAIPKNLIESDLFGYEGGSFTGADRGGRSGKIELANGGTLFLDEIGDMPFEVQAVLLRVLEDKQVVRVGGHRSTKINFRLIAATNKNIAELAKSGQFREDLYFRLSILNINLPPLRQRGNDIEVLANYFLEKHCANLKRPALQLSTDTLKKLKDYNWPGNVRQLENAIISAIHAQQGNIIKPDSLPSYMDTAPLPTDDDSGIEAICTKMGGKFSLTNWEEAALKASLIASNNCIPEAANLLQISKATMYRKLKLFNIKV
ncbi:MAG: sigma 54-interacting transcriptional regulator [Sporomusaceae bacterium]|jgi:transcriptional regulator with PAS, ATPase and Fis domain|nr:sigma 54-interacting transcriptional regulator [Sporomusaceae bacterium]